jgi:hypothetical protein
MSDEAPMLTAEMEAAIRRRVDAATPGPWGWNSYSAIHSAPIMQAETDDTPDYPEGKRPGPPFFTDEDNAWLAQREAAYEADPLVAWVPAHYGDTATGRHAADADFIAHTRTDIPTLLTEIDQLRARLAAAEMALSKAQDGIIQCQQHGRQCVHIEAVLRVVNDALVARVDQAPEPQGADAYFIAEARTDIPVLLTTIDQLRARLAAAEALRNEMADLLVAILNYRVPGDHPSGRVNPLSGPLLVRADQMVSRSKAAYWADRQAPEPQGAGAEHCADCGADAEGTCDTHLRILAEIMHNPNRVPDAAPGGQG